MKKALRAFALLAAATSLAWASLETSVRVEAAPNSCSASTGATSACGFRSPFPSPIPGYGGFYTYGWAGAQATYGWLGTSVQAGGFTLPDGAIINGSSSAQFSDTLTIDGGTNRLGYVAYSITGEAFWQSDGNGYLDAFDLYQNGSLIAYGSVPTYGYFENLDQNSLLVPIQFGVPFTLDMTAQTGTFGIGSGDSFTNVGISNMEVFDANMDPVDFTVTSASGQFLAPEPSSWILLAPVIAGVGFRLRRRRFAR